MKRVSGVANSWQNFAQFCGKIWPLLKKFNPVEIFTFLKAFVLKNQTIFVNISKKSIIFLEFT
jgi:hypothetical protein